MKKETIFFFLPILFLNICFAQSESIVVYAGEIKTINYTLINAASHSQTYTVSLVGPTAYFAERKVLIDVYPKIVQLEPNQSTKITLYIFSSKEAREISSHLFSLIISSEEQRIEKPIIISVLRKHPVFISSLNLSKYSIFPLENTRITVRIQNLRNEITPKYKLLFFITKDGREVLTREIITDFIEANSNIEVFHEFYAEKYQEAGIYDVYVRLEDLKGEYVDDARTKFEVKAVVKLPQEYTEKQIKYSFLSARISIKVRNEGNTFSEPFYIEEKVPIFMKDFVKEYTPSSEQKHEGGFFVLRWNIKSLAPAESVLVEYEISLWQTWLILVLIILVVFYFFKRGFQPALVKTVKISDNKIKVYIKLKNKSKSTMKNIEVSEEVLPMLSVESSVGMEFEEKKIGKKRYLVWKIDELRPDEEVIIGYVASPLVEIVSLELPKTHVSYIDEKGRKRVLE